MSRKTLHEVLTRARRELGMTQRELASQVGVKPSHIAYIENGKRKPSLRLATRIADALGLNPRELLFLFHPELKYLVGASDNPPSTKKKTDSWQRFSSNRALLKRHQVTRAELSLLKQVSLLEPVSSSQHFVFILTSIRQAAVPND
jgi:transcriptional regulator with XRE-family HTH domain